jgi:cytochrome c oxidase assembly protein subunit 15
MRVSIDVTKPLSRLPRISPHTYRRLTLVLLVALVLIIAVGASVRLTGSGMGCPTWPSCEPDSLTPRSASDLAGVIEFGNRLAGGVVGLLALTAVVGAHLRAPRRRDLFGWSLLVAGLVVANGLLGAQVVWLHLSPVVVATHFLLALTTLGAGVVLHHRASETADEPRPVPSLRQATCTPAFRRACNVLIAAAGATVIMGTLVTGSGPHAGDDEAERFSFAVGEVARIHGITAVLFLGVSLAVLWMAQRGDATAAMETRLRALVLVLLLQSIVGYTQYFTGVPTALVLAHVVGSALVWIAVLRVRLGLSELVPMATPPTPTGAVEPAVARAASGARDWNGCQSRQSQSRSTSRSAASPTSPTGPGS